MNKNILIVDDDKRLRELLKDYLTEKNFQVYQSEDYNEAKEILSLVLFDLIILDRINFFVRLSSPTDNIMYFSFTSWFNTLDKLCLVIFNIERSSLIVRFFCFPTKYITR